MSGGVPEPLGPSKCGVWGQLSAGVGWKRQLPGDWRPGTREGAEEPPAPRRAKPGAALLIGRKGPESQLVPGLSHVE